MARACSSEKAKSAGWLSQYQGAFGSELRLLSAVLTEIKVLVVVLLHASPQSVEMELDRVWN